VDKNVDGQTDINTDPQDMYYFAALNVAVVVFTIVRTMLFYKMAMRSSTQLHNAMYTENLVESFLYFFILYHNNIYEWTLIFNVNYIFF